MHNLIPFLGIDVHSPETSSRAAPLRCPFTWTDPRRRPRDPDPRTRHGRPCRARSFRSLGRRHASSHDEALVGGSLGMTSAGIAHLILQIGITCCRSYRSFGLQVISPAILPRYCLRFIAAQASRRAGPPSNSIARPYRSRNRCALDRPLESFPVPGAEVVSRRQKQPGSRACRIRKEKWAWWDSNPRPGDHESYRTRTR